MNIYLFALAVHVYIIINNADRDCKAITIRDNKCNDLFEAVHVTNVAYCKLLTSQEESVVSTCD
jgi:hypothetical protein